jgi:hypothetical protein
MSQIEPPSRLSLAEDNQREGVAMSLYLCIFDGDEEVDGVEIGYSEFDTLRDYVIRELERGQAGSRFPTFILHSGCDGEWTATGCDELRGELEQIAKELKARPAVDFVSDWHKTAGAKSIGITPQNAFESFLDHNGQYLIARLQELVEYARKHRLPILFQ